MNSSDIYWLTRLDGIGDLFVIASVICALIALLIVAGPTASSDSWRRRKMLLITSSVFAVLFSMACVLTPTTKEACAIIALPAIANNADMQEIGADVVELTKDWLEEMKP